MTEQGQTLVKKPTTRRGKKALENKGPKIIENVKSQLILRGTHTSNIVNEILRDFHKLKTPYSKLLFRRLPIHPFDDLSNVEFLCDKNDSSLFMFGSHSKKRPHNLIMGRMFDYKLLDIFEFGVDPLSYKSINYFVTQKEENDSNMRSVEKDNKSFRYSSKPCLLFQGEIFNNNHILKLIRNFFIDYFHGFDIKNVNLLGIDHIIVFTAIQIENNNNNTNSTNNANGNTSSTTSATATTTNNNNTSIKLFIRHYNIEFQKSREANNIPYVYLKDIGPNVDLYLRRYERAKDDVQKKARVKPIEILNKKPKQKNVSHDVIGQKQGRLYIQNQDLLQLKTKKVKALKKMKKPKNDENKKDNNNNNNNNSNGNNDK